MTDKAHVTWAAISALLATFWIPTAQSEVPKPNVPAAKGERCVEDTAVMRRNHMELLKHQRNATVRRGVRTEKHSLNGCFRCHSVEDENGSVADIESPKHFCNSCHAYVAVRIDCFDCHAAKHEEDL